MQCTLCPTVPHSHGVRYIQQAIHYEGSANSNRQFECVRVDTTPPIPTWTLWQTTICLDNLNQLLFIYCPTACHLIPASARKSAHAADLCMQHETYNSELYSIGRCQP